MSELNEIEDLLQVMQKDIEKIKKEYQKTSQEKFKLVVKTIFEKWGDRLDSIQWVQYTPYFNDGEACEFDVHDVVPVPKFEEDFDFEYGPDSYYVKEHIEDHSKNKKEDFAEFEAMEKDVVVLNSIDDEIMKEMFGDHVLVKVTKDKIETEDYSHD